MLPALRHVLHRCASSATSRVRPVRPGALCTDHTFTRVLGTRNESEVILADLMYAWRRAQTGDASAYIESVEICDRTVHAGAAPHSKGELVVDVRVAGGGESYLVEVQHRIEALFPHRAVIYAAAEIVAHHMQSPSFPTARSVHSLAFCDYDFQDLKKDGSPSPLSVNFSKWRTSSALKPLERRALQIFFWPAPVSARHGGL